LTEDNVFPVGIPSVVSNVFSRWN